jgi:ABC-type Fe3+ transport system permease subunit
VQLDTLRLLGGWPAVLRDQLRQALPAAAIGGALAVVFIFSDFAVADFLSSVGPKLTPYGESLYVYYQIGDRAAEAGAALPGLALMWVLLAWALHRRRKLGAILDARFEPAPPLVLGRIRLPLTFVAVLLVGAGALFPFAALAWQAGSLELVLEQARLAEERVAFSAATGAVSATLMMVLGLTFAALAARARQPWRVDLFVLLPLGVPAFLTGVGLIHTWNQSFFEEVFPSYYTFFYDGMGIIVVALAGRYLAFAYFCCTGALERLKPGLFECARIAGAGPLRRAVRVFLPLCSSSLIAAWCFSFCFSLRELDALQVLSAGQETLPYWLYMNIIFKREDEVAALALLLCLLTYLPLLFSILFARRSVRFL